MANPSRYRYIQFYGGRILQAREVSEMQRIQEGLDSGGVNRVAFDLDAIYREGATFNIASTISSNSITLSKIDSSLPLLVFVRGQWEILQPSEISTLTIPSSGGNVYLNWIVRQVTNAEDATLVDTNTGEPTADMGELDLTVSNTDTSGVALSSTQFEKNNAPIILFTYDSSQTLVPIDNVNSNAHANANTSGLVSLTTSSSNGKAASSDDSRLSDSRNPIDLSVHDSSVRVPVPAGGTNSADGTNTYNLTSDIGGISSAKIVHIPGTELVSDLLEWIKGNLSNFASILTSHIGIKLGLNTTHPMPNAVDVGATPASHVGMQLGLPGSHPATVTTNSGGFALNRDSSVAPNANDPAYGVFSSGTNKASLNHDGDIYSAQNSTKVVTPLAPATTSGSLGNLSTIASVLQEHVNQTTHNNPHGLVLADLTSHTISNVTQTVGGKTYGSIYQNTTGAALIVTVVGTAGSGGGTQVAYCDSSSNPSTVVNSSARPAAGVSDGIYPTSLTFIVPANFYYKVVNSPQYGSDNLTFNSWVEYSF